MNERVPKGFTVEFDRSIGAKSLSNGAEHFWLINRHISTIDEKVNGKITCRLDEMTEKTDTGIVLDLGCGSEAIAISEVQEAYPKLTALGIDIAADAFSLSGNRLLASMTNIPLANESVELLWSFEAFCKLPPNKRLNALGEILRVLQPDGRAILAWTRLTKAEKRLARKTSTIGFDSGQAKVWGKDEVKKLPIVILDKNVPQT